MDHPFTPPARIPAFLPKPKTPNTVKKSKAEYFGTLPAKLDAHLTEEELQQLTRNSMEAAHPIISGSHSRSSRSPRSSVNYDRRYGRSGSVSSMLVTQAPRKLTGAAGLTVLDLMQAQHSSSNNFPASYPHTQDIPHLTGLDVQLPSGSPSGSISLTTFDNKGRDLKYYHDGPSPPASAPTFIPRGSSKHLTGAALHLPQDEVPASVAHPIGADLKLPDDGGPVIQSPFTVALNHFDELEESTFIAALLLEKMDSKPSTPIDKLPIDDSSAPTPPSPPVRKYSAKSVSTESSESVIITPTTTTTMVYKMIPPPSVVALTSNLGSRGEPSSDLNRSLPAKTPVYTFIPPPPISSSITSDLDASIPSNIPSPIGSSVTATQQPQMNSFIPPPHTVPIGSPATRIQELLDNFSITTPQSVSRIASPAVEPYSKPSAYMPPSMATHYRESSAVARAEGTCDKAANPGGNTIQRSNSGRAVPGALCEAIAGFNRAFNGQGRPQTPIELSAVSNAAVQSPISQVPAPVHGSTSNTLQKPQPVMALPDAALSPQPPFRNKSQLNHSPNLHQNPIMSGQPPGAYLQQPNIYLRNTIDRQLPANAPSLHIETVPSFPRPVAKEASFWKRRKKALTILLVIVLLGIGVGIVFVAHSFYRRWGGVGFLKKRGVEGLNKKREYVQAERGDVWGHQNKKGRDGKKGGHGKGKGLLESMLVGGYKRGWSIDYKDEDCQRAPKEPKKFPHVVQVIPGEELISSHPKSEDALKHAAVLAKRFVEDIKARMEGNGPSCPPACRSESDVEVARLLASDYVDRVPIDVANEYDVEMLMSSMDSVKMQRLAQEVAILAAKGYVARVPGDVRKMTEGEGKEGQRGLDARGAFAEGNIERLMWGNVREPEPEAERVTVTVTETRVNVGAPTGLSPQDQAKQFASGYIESLPHEG